MKKSTVIVCLLMTGMLLVSCTNNRSAGAGAEARDIEGVQWYLKEVAGSPISSMAEDKQPHIMLDPDRKQATGFSGCNNFFGGYLLEGLSLKFGPVGATRMACPDLETGLETEVFKALEQTKSGKIQGGELIFLDGTDVLARFTQEKIQGLSGPLWRWRQTLYSDDRKAIPDNPEKYTVAFNEDLTLNVRADCNQKGGVYSVSPEEKNITIEITHSTMAFCPDASLEEEFVKGLTSGATYFINEGDLYIDLKYDTGTMRFSQQ